MTELKAGDSLDFTIGDKTLTVEPVPFGNIKKILKVVYVVTTDLSSGRIGSLPDLLDKNIIQVVPLMFRNGKYPFLTPEWLDDNVTVPVLRKMMEAAIVVNGLKDFFEKAARMGAQGKTSPATPPIPPENSGSTISSGSVTDGGQKT